MANWKDCKDSGSWAFTPQENKYGYLNNALWSSQQDAIDFCEDQGLELDLPNQHLPCGHFHKAEVTEEPFPAGKWVAAMQQPGTPYIYVYDILQKAVIRIDTSEIPVFVSGRLELDSAYALDYDMGQGGPGAQRGAYCMNKDGTRIWYLFCDQGAYPVARGRPDAQLIEVDISKTTMRIAKKTLFPNLLPSEPYPDPNWGRVNDGCSDDTYTYWCTDLVAGRIIKIRNADHSIIDDHTFNYSLECGGGTNDEPIATIDYNKNNKKLYWIYVRELSGCTPPHLARRHFVRSDTDLVQEIDDIIRSSEAVYGNPAWQNLIRIYTGRILHHRAYHPSNDAYLMKRGSDCVEDDEVVGSDGHRYACKKSHFAAIADRPTTGGNWPTYWVRSAESGGAVWSGGQSYTCTRIQQEYLQNIFGIKNGNLFTLMHVNSLNHPAFLYCIDFSDMEEKSKLDVSYYAGQIHPPGGYDWDWTSVSAMNYQTGVIAIFRYHNVEERNYVGCFNADSDLGFLCDVPLHSIKHTSGQRSDEPQVWTMPDDDAPISAGGEDIGDGNEDGSVMCVGQSSELSQNPISASVMEGSNAVNRSIRVIDNCGDFLAFQIEEVNNNNWTTWISSPVVGSSGNGTLNVNFSTASLSAGSYAGSIVISTALGNLTLNINLVITSSPGYGEATGIVLLKGDQYRTFDFRTTEIKLFKFIADSGPSSPTLTITVKQLHHASLDFLVKYSGQNWELGPPIDSDYSNVEAAIEADPFTYPPHVGIYNGLYYYKSRFHYLDAPGAYGESLGFNCPFPPGHHSYCAVCKEFLKCKAGEGWCSGSWHCAAGLICDEEVHKCVVPVYIKQIVINYPSPIANGCWYLWMKNFRPRDLDDNKIYFDFS